MSFPGIGGSITRAAQVTCQYLDENGLPQIISARGFLARALQHGFLDVLIERRPPLARRDDPFWQRDDLIGEVIGLFGLLEPPELENLEDLLEIE